MNSRLSVLHGPRPWLRRWAAHERENMLPHPRKSSVVCDHVVTFGQAARPSRIERRWAIGPHVPMLVHCTDLRRLAPMFALDLRRGGSAWLDRFGADLFA